MLYKCKICKESTAEILSVKVAQFSDQFELTFHCPRCLNNYVVTLNSDEWKELGIIWDTDLNYRLDKLIDNLHNEKAKYDTIKRGD